MLDSEWDNQQQQQTNKCLLSTYLVPDAILSASHARPHLILIVTIWGRDYCYAHLTDRETETSRGNLSKVRQTVSQDSKQTKPGSSPRHHHPRAHTLKLDDDLKIEEQSEEMCFLKETWIYWRRLKKKNFKSSESLIFWSLVTTIDYHSPEWVMNTFGLIKEWYYTIKRVKAMRETWILIGGNWEQPRTTETFQSRICRILKDWEDSHS